MAKTQIHESSLEEETAMKAAQCVRTFYAQERKLYIVNNEM